jgi:hypothetical protein
VQCLIHLDLQQLAGTTTSKVVRYLSIEYLNRPHIIPKDTPWGLEMALSDVLSTDELSLRKYYRAVKGAEAAIKKSLLIPGRMNDESGEFGGSFKLPWDRDLKALAIGALLTCT